MMRDASDHGAPTRRDYITYSEAGVEGGLLTSCTNDSGSASTQIETQDRARDETDGATTSNTAGGRPGRRMAPTKCVKPDGCHPLDEPPEEYLVHHQGPVDMMMSFEQAGGLVAPWFPSTVPKCRRADGQSQLAAHLDDDVLLGAINEDRLFERTYEIEAREPSKVSD